MYMLSSFRQVGHHGSSRTPAWTPALPYKVLSSLTRVSQLFISEGSDFESRLSFILFSCLDVFVSPPIIFSSQEEGLLISDFVSPLLGILLYAPDPDLFLVIWLLRVESSFCVVGCHPLILEYV